MDAFIASGGLRGTAIGPHGLFDPVEDSENYHKEWQKKRYEQEAKKLWLRMRNEVISELQEKGFDIEWLLKLILRQPYLSLRKKYCCNVEVSFDSHLLYYKILFQL